MWEDLMKILIRCSNHPLCEASDSDPGSMYSDLTDFCKISNSRSQENVVQWLTSEVPVEVEGNLAFKARVVQLPKSTQKSLLNWFIQHTDLLSKSDMMDVLQAFQNNPSSDAWVCQLVNILKMKILPDTKSTYTFTTQTQKMHSALLEKCRSAGRRREVEIAQGKELSVPALSPGRPQSHSQDNISLVQDMEGIVTNEPSHLTPATQSSQGSEVDSVQVQADLSESTRLQVDALVDIWRSGESTTADFPSQLSCLVDCTTAQFEAVCRRLCFGELSEACLSTACLNLVSLGSQLSHHNTVILAQSSLLNRVMNLSQTPSRTLISSIKTLFGAYPQATIDGVLLPSLTMSTAAAAQADVTTRVIKEDMTSQNRRYLLGKFVSGQQPWTEAIIGVIQTLVDLKTEIDKALLSEIVEKLRQVEGSDSPKLAKLILGIIQKYGKMLTASHGSELKLILQKNTSFVRKPALAALNKLKLDMKS